MNTDPNPEDSANVTPKQDSTQSEASPPAAPEASSSSTPPPTGSSEADNSGLSKDSLNMGMLCHLLAFCGLVVPAGNILGPLILWLVKKDQDAYVDEQGKESVNFQISVTLYIIGCVIIALTVILMPVAVLLMTVIGLAALVLTIIGTIKASKGEPWKYPLTIRLIK